MVLSLHHRCFIHHFFGFVSYFLHSENIVFLSSTIYDARSSAVQEKKDMAILSLRHIKTDGMGFLWKKAVIHTSICMQMPN
jgi:hypothetical protein